MRDASALDKTPRSLAVRITGASEKRAKAAALDGHLLAAIVAVLGLGFPASLFRSLRGEVLNEIAFGIARAAQEESVAANAFEQLALAALFALFPRRDAGLIGKHLVVGLVEVDDEFLPELFDGFAPRQLAFFDFVQLFFEPRGKCHVDDVLETLDKLRVDALVEYGGRISAMYLSDVIVIVQCCNGRRI